MTTGNVAAVCAELFDDAAMFPPEGAPIVPALHTHLRHKASWYREMVGPLVCLVGRLRRLASAAEMAGETVDVAVVVPDGLSSVPAFNDLAHGGRLRPRSIEVALGTSRLKDARRRLEPLLAAGLVVYLEMDPSRLTESFVHELTRSGVRLKLRLGETLLDTFRTEEELAATLVLCAAEPLALKCNAGLHLATRHRDLETTFEHHGYLNIALAARVAASTGNVMSVKNILRERSGSELAATAYALTMRDVMAIRALLASVSTSSVAESVSDLVRLNLVSTTG
jgi:hypothetical protein